MHSDEFTQFLEGLSTLNFSSVPRTWKEAYALAAMSHSTQTLFSSEWMNHFSPVENLLALDPVDASGWRLATLKAVQTALMFCQDWGNEKAELDSRLRMIESSRVSGMREKWDQPIVLVRTEVGDDGKLKVREVSAARIVLPLKLTLHRTKEKAWVMSDVTELFRVTLTAGSTAFYRALRLIEGTALATGVGDWGVDEGLLLSLHWVFAASMDVKPLDEVEKFLSDRSGCVSISTARRLMRQVLPA